MHPLRRTLDAIFYVLRTGCPWRYLPTHFPPWHTMYYHVRQFRRKNTLHPLYPTLHRIERERVGRHPVTSAAVMDSQSVKTVEESAHMRGYDAHKCVNGRKRHLLVDTLGLPRAWYVSPADAHDTVGARDLLSGLAFFLPRLKKIWADAACRGEELAEWCQQQGGGWDLEVVERAAGSHGFQLLPRMWVVERSLAWLPRNWRLANDYDQTRYVFAIYERTTMRLIGFAALRNLEGQRETHCPLRH